MKPWEIITRLESNNSRIFKEKIIDEQFKQKNWEFFEGINLALDGQITFGVKKVPEKIDEDGPGLVWNVFNEMCQTFVKRTVTGNSAKDAISEIMKYATKDQWNNWYRRILIKDLRCGVSDATINSIVPKTYWKKKFSCQLAHEYFKHEKKVFGERIIENKLDGVRVFTIVLTNGALAQYSRNGKDLNNFPKIKEQIRYIASSFQENMVLDGEIMSGSFQNLMKQVHRKDSVDSDDAVLNLFDMIPLKDFNIGVYNVPQRERTRALRQWYENNKESLENVTVLNHETINLDTQQGQDTFKRYNKNAIDNGFEGIMIKDPMAPYECKRTISWLKLKPFIEVSLEVTDVEEGTGKNVGRLGAFVCSGVDDGKLITVNVGSGFSDDNRIEFYRDRNLVVGRIVEVRADAVTQNQDGSYSLRFPRFKCFRGFEAGEKI